jgi:parallel beta-helix repeat protein
MRWYILNRLVAASSSATLTLETEPACYGASCAGWGYFINNHLSTLDQDGEWYFDAAQNRIYLYSANGAPGDGTIEGTVILRTGDDTGRSWGGITLGEDLTGQGISYVRVENLAVRRWWRDGIAIPTNFANFEPHHLVIRNNTIQDVDHVGINLATWVYDALDGRPDGWRGGYHLTVSGNTIERPNNVGIDLYSRDSIFSNNIIRDAAQIKYLGRAGMGCGFADGEGACTEDGDGIRVKIDQVDDSGNSNTFSGNRLERIGYSGIQIFGFGNTLEHNVITEACNSKGDCGAISTYSGTSLDTSPVHDLAISKNIIVDTIGNTDGCLDEYDPLFAFGLYLGDSRDTVIVGNTVIGTTVHGILLMNSSGSVTDNTLYNNGIDRPSDGSQLYVGSPPSAASTHTGNILYALSPDTRTLSVEDVNYLGTSDDNYFFNPFSENNIYADGDLRSLSSWRTYSGKDAESVEQWFTLNPGDPPNSTIFYNDTSTVMTIDLADESYVDLDQNPVSGNLTLQPYASKILIKEQ